MGWGMGGRKRVDMNYEKEQKKRDRQVIKRNSKHLQCIYVRFLFPVKMTLKCLKNINDTTFLYQDEIINDQAVLVIL